MFAGTPCFDLIDDQSALGAIVKGSCKVGDLCKIVATVWEEICRIVTLPWTDYLESDFNVVEPMSRGDGNFVEKISAKALQAKSPQIAPLSVFQKYFMSHGAYEGS